ncbi:Dps family protein [Paenibacillus sp. GCM10023252]|uniref:Dps family protein n=1 Tax=Paenibacillus sp. GCM10023252 TaxID=3252649 RepID=UPI003612D16C
MAKTTTKPKTLNEVLNKQVANWSVLYMKLHHYHWYVKGDSFFTLHVKFEELYTEAALHLDVIAERLLARKGKPTATLQEQLELSSVSEAKGSESASDMVKQLAADFELLAEELVEGIELAEESKDQPTADMLISIRNSIEKHAWMLTSFLGK